MGSTWSDQHRYDLMLEVEIRVCEALAKRSVIPGDAAGRIRAKASVDGSRVAEIEAEVHHDVIAFVSAVAESVGEDGRYLHYGMTSSDVLDTAFALQLVEAVDQLLEGVSTLMEAVRSRAREYRDTPIAGRSHGIHAQPTTFGLKLAGWYAELKRDRFRLLTARETIASGKLSGAVGTYGVNGPDIEAEVLDGLGLTVEPVATQVVPRDRHAEFFCTLAVLAGGLERFATEIRHLQRTEVGEVLESFSKGQKGSSAMPHKRNPILTENISGLARLVRANSLAALENIALWHERDISHSSVERVIAPDSTIALDFMLARMTSVVTGMEVRPEAMAANLERTGGRMFSEKILLALVENGISRDEAYRWVQRCALAEGDFRANAEKDTDISRVLDASRIEKAFDMKAALGHAHEVFDRVIEEGT